MIHCIRCRKVERSNSAYERSCIQCARCVRLYGRYKS